MTVLTTNRLTLRGPRASDIDDLFAIYSDARAMAFWSTPPHKSRSVTQERLDRWISGFNAEPYYFAVVLQGRVVGNCGAHSGNEIGFILHPDVWGKGIGKEAMQAVISYLWQVTEFPDLKADLDPRNGASKGLLLALGFTESGYAKDTYCIGGEWSDSLYMTLPRPE